MSLCHALISFVQKEKERQKERETEREGLKKILETVILNEICEMEQPYQFSTVREREID